MSASDPVRPAHARWRRIGGLTAAGVTLAATLGGGVLLGLRAGRVDSEPPHAAGLMGGSSDEQSGRGNATDPPSVASQASGHETADLNGGLLGRLTLLLLTVAALMVAAMIGLHALVRQRTQDARPVFTADQQATISAPTPHLQADPAAEIAALDQQVAARLNGYGWVAPDHRRARIPIGRAMALSVGQSLAPPP